MEEVKAQFEFVIAGKTYTSKKVTPQLRGRITKVTALLLKSAEESGISRETLSNPDNYPDWLRVLISGSLWEHLPEIMWDFLNPEDKTSIGTRDNFYDALTDESVTLFYAWAQSNISQANEYLKKTSEPEELPRTATS